MGAPVQAQRLGDVAGVPLVLPKHIEFSLSWGPVIRGLRWGGGPDVALFLHEPGADVDAWGGVPARVARSLDVETIAFDLPGHGLSDGPWALERILELVRVLTTRLERDDEEAQSRGYVIAAGEIAHSALLQAADLQFAGLVMLSPCSAETPDVTVPRSPMVPKLMIAGSLSDQDLASTRQLASASGGWAVVTSVPVATRGTGLLATPWAERITEEIIAFLRDCRGRDTSGPSSIVRADFASPP